MLFVDPILRITRLGVASSYVKNDEPVSMMLLGDPEIGKSSILLRFNPPKGVYRFTDLTKSSMSDFFERISDVRYIIVPDFIKVTSHSEATRGNTLSMLNAGMEEGLMEVTQYAGGVPRTKILKPPLRFGMMTSMTRATISDRRREWHRIGFFSRLLPVSFSYTKEQQRKIRDYIASGHDIFEEKEKLRLSRRTVKCAKRFVLHFEPFFKDYAEAQHLYGFRLTKQFRGLLKASALLRGASSVTGKDVKALESLLPWVNLNYNAV